MITRSLKPNHNNRFFAVRESKNIYGRRQKYYPPQETKNKHGGSSIYYKIFDYKRGNKIYTYFCRITQFNNWFDEIIMNRWVM